MFELFQVVLEIGLCCDRLCCVRFRLSILFLLFHFCWSLLVVVCFDCFKLFRFFEVASHLLIVRNCFTSPSLCQVLFDFLDCSSFFGLFILLSLSWILVGRPD